MFVQGRESSVRGSERDAKLICREVHGICRGFPESFGCSFRTRKRMIPAAGGAFTALLRLWMEAIAVVIYIWRPERC